MTVAAIDVVDRIGAHMNPNQTNDSPKVAVVGGGLAGLTAAVFAARGGAAVTLFDARSELGGRARSHAVGDALFNEGPHALYNGLAGMGVLVELGVRISGGAPAAPVRVERNGRITLLPTSPTDSLRRTDLSRTSMMRVAWILLAGRGPAAVAGQSMADWIDGAASGTDARKVLQMLTRVATYVDDLGSLDARSALAQVRSASTSGVTYLDDGFASIVTGLRAAAETAGVDLRPADRVTAVAPGRPPSVTTDGGTTEFDAVVIAGGGPPTVNSLLAGASPAVERWTDAAEPVTASTLDLHLDGLPEPGRRVVFSLDRPLYLSVHTPSARLAGHGEVAHLMRNGAHDDGARAELEEFADRCLPGWRDCVLAEQWGQSRVVMHDRPHPGGGLAGRPPVEVPDAPGILVAGDWVGPVGLLSDAALSSGRTAGRVAAASTTMVHA